jgi:hypothetical protein
VVHGLSDPDVPRAATDHHRELELPIVLLSGAPEHDVVARAAQCARQAGEDERVLDLEPPARDLLRLGAQLVV